jgi:isopenicillin-N epimerase
MLEPLVVSWGWRPEPGYGVGSPLLDRFGWLGTDDPSAHLALPAALEFMQEHDWPAVRARCHALLSEALPHLEAMAGMPSLYRTPGDYRQLAAVELPPEVDGAELQRRLYDEHRIEVPVTAAGERRFLRVSVQGYNQRSDLEALVEALRSLL